MIYSVWNTRARRYDYYESAGTPPTHAPPAMHVRASTPLGATPEGAAWPLPAGARMIGSGDAARGRIARLGGAPIDMGGSRTFWIVGGLLTAAVLAKRYLR